MSFVSGSFISRIQAAVLNFARTKQCCYRSWENFNLCNNKFQSIHQKGTFKTMTGVHIEGLSNLPALLSGGESPVQLSLSMNRAQKSSSSSVQSTPDIEKKYVHHVYDAIAPHFSSTRFAKWPKVSTFLNSLRPGSLVLDVGCGNGKYLGLNPDCSYVGCDVSPPLIDICTGRRHEVMVADAVNLPYRTDFGDAAISIAVLHHLSTESRRKKAIEELVRVVRKGGLALITVWAVEQEDKSLLTKWTPLTDKYTAEWVGPGSPRVRSSPSNLTLQSIPETEDTSGNKESVAKLLVDDSVEQLEEKMRPSVHVTSESEVGSVVFENESNTESQQVTSESELGSVVFENESNTESQQEYFVPWHLPYHRAEVSGVSASAVANGLAKRNDKKCAVVYNRYYHVFMEGELERLASGIENAVVRDRFYDKSNWCIILEKT